MVTEEHWGTVQRLRVRPDRPTPRRLLGEGDRHHPRRRQRDRLRRPEGPGPARPLPRGEHLAGRLCLLTSDKSNVMAAGFDLYRSSSSRSTWDTQRHVLVRTAAPWWGPTPTPPWSTALGVLGSWISPDGRGTKTVDIGRLPREHRGTARSVTRWSRGSFPLTAGRGLPGRHSGSGVHQQACTSGTSEGGLLGYLVLIPLAGRCQILASLIFAKP
jgi:hypothetical protein